MKKYIVILFLITLYGCSKDDSSGLSNDLVEYCFTVLDDITENPIHGARISYRWSVNNSNSICDDFEYYCPESSSKLTDVHGNACFNLNSDYSLKRVGFSAEGYEEVTYWPPNIPSTVRLTPIE